MYQWVSNILFTNHLGCFGTSGIDHFFQNTFFGADKLWEGFQEKVNEFEGFPDARIGVPINVILAKVGIKMVVVPVSILQ